MASSGKPDERLILVNKPVPDDRLRWRRFITEAAIDSHGAGAGEQGINTLRRSKSGARC